MHYARLDLGECMASPFDTLLGPWLEVSGWERSWAEEVRALAVECGLVAEPVEAWGILGRGPYYYMGLSSAVGRPVVYVSRVIYGADLRDPWRVNVHAPEQPGSYSTGRQGAVLRALVCQVAGAHTATLTKRLDALEGEVLVARWLLAWPSSMDCRRS